MDNRKDFYERAFLAALTGLCADPDVVGYSGPRGVAETAAQIAKSAVDAMLKAEESENG